MGVSKYWLSVHCWEAAKPLTVKRSKFSFDDVSSFYIKEMRSLRLFLLNWQKLQDTVVFLKPPNHWRMRHLVIVCRPFSGYIIHASSRDSQSDECQMSPCLQCFNCIIMMIIIIQFNPWEGLCVASASYVRNKKTLVLPQ